MIFWKKSTALLAAALAIVVGTEHNCGAQAAQPVTVQLKWTHQAQFAGFYLARDSGYYADQGLDVRFLEGGRDVDGIASLVSGTADFGVLAPESIIIGRSGGIPLTAIAAIYRRSAVVFLSLPGSGIVRPRDFLGRTVAAAGGSGVLEFQIQLKAMLKVLGLNASRITLTDYDIQYTDFLSGRVDITPAYITGGLIKIRRQGVKPTIIWPGDYRVRFYSDTLAATESVIRSKPDLVTRFLKATLKGWTEAVGDPDTAVDHVMNYAPGQERELQAAMMEALLPLVHTGEDAVGWMTVDDWRHMHSVLADQELVSCPESELEKAYTLEFLKAVYGGAP